jgi:1,4-alpha-glucan branching enzyme
MAKLGAISFVLHWHLPYCRLAGGWPHGEVWIHEAAAETYIPLLNALFDLHAQGTPVRLTLSLTPVLCEQLADPGVQARLSAYLDDKLARAEGDMARFTAEGAFQRARLAGWYIDWYTTIKDSFERRYSRDILGALRRLQALGVVEIITSAATHAYLPLLATDENVRAQLRVATASHRRHFKHAPHGLWLPACAYRPELETHLAKNQEALSFFFADAHSLTQGNVLGRAAGGMLGHDGRPKRNPYIPFVDTPCIDPAPRAGSTFTPYFVGRVGESSHSGVVTLARNELAISHVWNGDGGYPGDKDYRDFYERDPVSGLHYWRVTQAIGAAGRKEEWNPQQAIRRAGEHARHFVQAATDFVQAHAAQSKRFGIVCAAFDAELFGHWWFEGMDWLRETLQLLATSDALELTTAGDYIDQHPPEEVLMLPAASGQQGELDRTWNNVHTQELWQAIHQTERRMVELARIYQGCATLQMEPLLAQLARENLLLQSSDWPALITSGQARDYALQRFGEHLGRFNLLADALARGRLDVALPAELYEQDKVFPDLDWRWWA